MEGYAKVAQLMGQYEEFAILRRFKTLNYQNILYLQAQIIHLEECLGRLVEQDAAHPERRSYSRDWWTLAHGKGGAGKAQWKKIRRIRTKLEKYNDALLKQTFLSKLGSPNANDLEFLRSWLERPSMGSFPIRGLDRGAWDSIYENDLVAIKPRSPPDSLSRWVTNTIFPLYHRLLGMRLKRPTSPELGDGLYTYEDLLVNTVANVITTVVAALLPLLSVVVLFFLPTNELKLGFIVLFSAGFALALALTTNARKIEVFAATSAFAAVNVVFLTNTIPALPN